MQEKIDARGLAQHFRRPVSRAGLPGQVDQLLRTTVMQEPLHPYLHESPVGVLIREIADHQCTAWGHTGQQLLQDPHENPVREIVEQAGGPYQS